MKTILFATLLVTLTSFAQESKDNSDVLIARALEKKEITLDEAWKLRMMARFETEKLPAKYQGPKDQVLDHIHNELTGAITKLSAATQQELVGYFVPPVYPESKFKVRQNPSPSTNKLNLATDPVGSDKFKYMETADLRIWWDKEVPTDESYAKRVADIAPGVIRKLEMLTGKKLMSDAGQHEFRDLEGKRVVWGDNGNGKFDIWIGNLEGVLALTVPYPPGCSQVPSFMLIRRTMLGEDKYAEATLAHEFMHVFQNLYDHGFDCSEYTRIEEGTAHWSIQYIFPKNNYERYDNAFYFTASYSLADWSYASWPFYLFMERTMSPSAIPQIFENFGLQKPMEAVNAVLNGGFAKQFPEYTIREWNKTNLVEGFKEWDDLEWTPKHNDWPKPIPETEMKVDDDGGYYFKDEMKLQPLTRRYYNFKFTDKTIRSIQFSATMGWEMTKKVRLKVLIRKGQAWVQEDWSDKKEAIQYCQDVPEDRMDEIVLIFSNTDFPKDGDNGQIVNTGFEVEATNIGCNKLTGSFKSSLVITNPSMPIKVTATAQVAFGPGGVNEGNQFIGQFHALSGSGYFTYEGTIEMGNAGGKCTANQTIPFKVMPGKKNSINIYPYYVIPQSSRQYIGAIGTFDQESFTVLYKCPNGMQVPTQFVPTVFSTMNPMKANRDGTLSGKTKTPPMGGVEMEYEWSIHPQE